MSHPGPYDPSPHLRGTPIRLDEVDALVFAGGKPLAKDAELLRHFLDRVQAALRDAQMRQDALRDELEQARIRVALDTHPVENARLALAALSEEQMRDLLDAGYWEALDELRAEQEAAQTLQLAMVTAARTVRFALGDLAADPTLPEETRARVKRLLANLPTPPPPVA